MAGCRGCRVTVRHFRTGVLKCRRCAHGSILDTERSPPKQQDSALNVLQVPLWHGVSSALELFNDLLRCAKLVDQVICPLEPNALDTGRDVLPPAKIRRHQFNPTAVPPHLRAGRVRRPGQLADERQNCCWVKLLKSKAAGGRSLVHGIAGLDLYRWRRRGSALQHHEVVGERLREQQLQALDKRQAQQGSRHAVLRAQAAVFELQSPALQAQGSVFHTWCRLAFLQVDFA